MIAVLPRAGWILAGVALVAASARAQSGSRNGTIAIPDSLFQPIRLPPVTSFGYPPNEIYIPRFIDLIRGRQFDSLDLAYDRLAADVRRDVRNEMRFADAFDAADRDDSTLLAGLDAWVAAKPRSAHARVARARYHFATAWRRRGKDYIRDTAPENLRGMGEYARRAMDDIRAGLQIDSTHLIAYAIGIGVMQIAGSHDEALRLVNRGLAMHPGSYLLPRLFISMLWPRWGGTEELMAQFAERAAEDSALNPRLVALRGAVHENRANDSSLAGNYAGAVRELNKALAYGPERAYLRARGIAYFRLGAYEYAFNDLRYALIERSQDEEVLEYYGRTLVELAARANASIRPTILARAIETLTLAAYLDPSNERSRAALTRARRMAGQ